MLTIFTFSKADRSNRGKLFFSLFIYLEYLAYALR